MPPDEGTLERGVRIYLARHSDAVQVGERGVTSDAERMLTAGGREKAVRLGRALARIGCDPGVVYTSPLVRARETAELAAARLPKAGRLSTCDALLPGADPADLCRLPGSGDGRDILCVGHMPHVSAAVSFLLTGDPDWDVVFKKAAACCLSFAGGPGPGYARLEWLIQPGQFRRLLSTRDA